MSTVDDRIVSLKFDNSQFEQKVATTLASLDKLSAKLANAGSSANFSNINSAAASVNFGPIAAGIDNISKKFGALGAVGFTAIQQITTGLLNFGVNAFKNDFLAPIIQGGTQRAQAIEQAKFQFQGLGIDVNSAMKSSLDAVKGTAFGLDEAASAAAQFGASGINAGQDMTDALRGIAGTAALTGRSFGEMAQIFTGSAGSGVVNNQDFMQFATRGLNAAAAYAKVAGLTEAQVHQMASKGQIDFKSFAAAMNVAFGAHATEANKTYQGSISNLHAAMSRLGASFIAPEHEQKRNIFNALSPVIDDLNAGMQPLFGSMIAIKGVLTGSLISKLGELKLGAGSLFNASMVVIGRALENVFIALAQVFNQVKAAFKDIFPGSTIGLIATISEHLLAFTNHLKLGGSSLEKVRDIFKGFFSIISIGITIIKGIVMVIGDIAKALFPAGAGLVSMGASTGNFLTKLQETLVTGGKIHEFFVAFEKVIRAPIAVITALGNKIKEFFSGSFTKSAVAQNIEGVGTAAEKVNGVFSKVLDALSGVGSVLGKALGSIVNWFKNLGSNIAAALSPSDFSPALSVINIGLLGGIAVMLKKFLSGGALNIFGGSFVNQLQSTIGAFTNSFKALQTQLKADALRKIAEAVAILAVSMLLLASINAADLAKALSAMAAGFGELASTLAILGTISSGPSGSAKLALLASTMIALSIAIGILSLSVKLLGDMDPGKLATGLSGVAGALAILVASTTAMSANPQGAIAGAFAIGILSISVGILAGTIKFLGNMDTGKLAQGLTGVAGALAILVAATAAISANPGGAIAGAFAISILSISVGLLAGTIKFLGNMDTGKLAQGLTGIAGALAILVAATAAISANPEGAIAGAFAIGVLAVSLGIMAGVIKKMGDLSILTLAKGIGALAAMLIILALGVTAMDGSIPGAIALLIVAEALKILGGVLKQLGELGIGQIVTGLISIAIFIALIAGLSVLLSEAIIPMFALGVALSAVGLGIALFGAGAFLFATAIQLIAVSGVAGAIAVVAALNIILESLPKVAAGIALFVVRFVEELVNAAPLLLKLITVLLLQILDTIIKLAPKIGKAFETIVLTGLKAMRDTFPEIVKTAFDLITVFLQGINDNIGKITDLGAQIIINFLNALSDKIPDIVNAAANLIITFLNELSNHTSDIVIAGTGVLISFILGIAQSASLIVDAVTNLIIAFTTELANQVDKLITAGVNILISLLQGITDNLIKISDAVVKMIDKLATSFDDNFLKLLSIGVMVLDTILFGIAVTIIHVADTVTQIIIALVNAIFNDASKIVDAGAWAMVAFLIGLGRDIQAVIDAGTNLVIQLMNGISKDSAKIADAAFNALNNFLTAFDKTIKGPYGAAAIADKGAQIGRDILSGIATGLADATGLGAIIRAAKSITDKIPKIFRDAWTILSPSKLFMKIATQAVAGLAVGFSDDSSVVVAATSVGNNITNALNKTLANLPNTIGAIDQFNPTITPVLDLTKVKSGAKDIAGYMTTSISPDSSLQQARIISATTLLASSNNTTPSQPGPTTVTFEQTINAPKELSTNDIYRSTKSQITMAKEELNIS